MSDTTRKLATIVALDVAGYSARTEADEARTTAEVAALRHVIEAIAKARGGRIFNTAGDGFMLEFGSSLMAVEASIELAEECRPKVRIGVHVGDVVVQPNGDLLGHGVNVAARLMAKSDPGAFLVSGTARQTMRGPLAEQLVSRGTVQLDKMAETIEVFALAGEQHPPAIGTGRKAVTAVVSKWPSPRLAAMGLLPILLVLAGAAWWMNGGTNAPARHGDANAAASIAVLPFENLSAEKDNAFFTAGIQDEILTRLSKIGALRVISRTSTEKYASHPENLTEISKELGVANILEGSVQRQGNDVRVNVQLIRADTDTHLWAEVYDRKLDNIFTVQSEIAVAIAEALSATVTRAEKQELAIRPTSNPEAYDAYLRGMEFARSLLPRKAQAEFQEAVRLDPDFALAWAMLARETSRLVKVAGRTPERMAAARTAIETAQRLQPSLNEVLIAKASYKYWVDGDLQGARELFEDAAARWPNNVDVKATLGYITRRQARWEESISNFRQAASLDPRSLEVRASLVETYTLAGDFDQAISSANDALTLWPGSSRLRSYLATVYQARGDWDKAGELLKGAQPDDPWYTMWLASQYMFTRHYAEALSATESFWSQAEASGLNNPTTEALVRNQMGDIRRLSGDPAAARQEYMRARDALLSVQKQQPNDHLSAMLLAISYTGLEDRANALKYAGRAIALLPATADAVDGRGYETTRARIWARFGDKDLAIPEIARLSKLKGVPQPLTPAILRVDTDFDKLRGDPRFEALLK